jgi:hypothetical protein
MLYFGNKISRKIILNNTSCISLYFNALYHFSIDHSKLFLKIRILQC